MNNDREVVVVAGARTPFAKMNTTLGRVHPVELGRIVVREAIERALKDNRYNKTAAAKQLGLTLRALRYRMQKLGID